MFLPGRLNSKNLFQILGFGLVIYGLARVSLLVEIDEGIALFWPVSGILLGVLLVTPQKKWAWYLFTAFLALSLANWHAGYSAPISLAYSAINALESLCAAFCVRRWIGSNLTFSCVREVVLFTLLVVFLSNGITAFLGAAVAAVGRGLPFFYNWLTWFIGDGVGIFVITPMWVIWAKDGRTVLQWEGWERVELFCLILATLLTGCLVFGTVRSDYESIARSYLVFPLLIWASMRFNTAVVTLMILLHSLLVLFLVRMEYGVFGTTAGSISLNEICLQLYLLATAIVPLLLSAMNTERTQALENLTQAKQVAEAAAQSKARFLDIAAHELRNPVAAISLILLLTEKQESKGHTLTPGLLKRLRAPADRLSRLVVDLFDVARLERGMMTLKPMLTDLGSLISNSISEFQTLAPERQFILNIPQQNIPQQEKSLQIELDPVRISQVLSNFLDNAIKYTPAHTPIEVRIEVGASDIRVAVVDHGVGISQEEQSKLFHPFSRLLSEKTEEMGGLGLGLSVSRGIIELHQGKIGVESKKGEGSTFYFEIPIKAAQLQTTRKEKSPHDLELKPASKLPHFFFDPDRFKPVGSRQ